MLLNDVETKILLRMFSEFGVDACEQDLSKIVIEERRYTGVGFFTDFSIFPDELCLPDKSITHWGHHVIGKVDGRDMGFIIYLTDGKATTIEGFVYDDDGWPEDEVKSFILLEN